jgi:hypothetical protein
MNKKIITDGDDTLINNMEMLNRFFNFIHGTNLKTEDYTLTDLCLIWGVTKNEIRLIEKLYFQSEFYSNLERIEGAYEAMDYLSKEYLPLDILTARPVDSEHYLKSTIERLYHKDHFEEIHHIGSPHDLSLIMQKWEKCRIHNSTLLIDDHPFHFLHTGSNGVHGILLTQPWNKYIIELPPLVYRARNWAEAVDIIDKKKHIIFKQ